MRCHIWPINVSECAHCLPVASLIICYVRSCPARPNRWPRWPIAADFFLYGCLPHPCSTPAALVVMRELTQQQHLAAFAWLADVRFIFPSLSSIEILSQAAVAAAVAAETAMSPLPVCTLKSPVDG